MLKKICIAINILLISYLSFGQELKNINYTYDPDIKTVLLYPASLFAPNIPLPPPILAINDPLPLILEFDKFGSDIERFAVKIINCNADWTVSELNPVEYLDDYNEFYIRDREFSMNTKVRYVHYRFAVPRVKVAGNYLLKVYEENNESRLILTCRFMVYENSAIISSTLATVVGVEASFRNQQIDFSVGYAGYQVYNPQEQIQVVLRQNFRWDKQITGLKPTFVNDFDRRLDYKHFNFENVFKGGNEFRMFDLRNLMARNLNIEHIEYNASLNNAWVYVDKSRNGWAYSKIMDDMNGRFFIQNLLMPNAGTDADYLNVTFTLKTENEELGGVYVTGAFSDWQLTEDYRMSYVPEKQAYQKTILLKQGFYNYQYSFTKNFGTERDDVYFEGTHSRTENNYEIFVYFRPLGFRTDLLIGYKLF
ncbi:type IX secretion system plug protein [Thermoflexibacter ruber]|uniref:Type 9 secretion system plug protein N-terminal domain-containing protein n=1 Tax=Thermoflexibacter ruber TaxID=1003 RepID=A0A1I2HJU8_9BACT|nr:type IX secretion system plug protein domain-containing protein [Thermoflexibacter ruber]SFF29560.1 protein of unknown function [Thermoflexibacter ruber]